MFYKPEIREKMLRRRKQLDVVSIAQASQAVAAQVVQVREFLDARQIACYVAVEGELDPAPILHCAQMLKKQIYLPMVVPSEGGGPQLLTFGAYQIGDPLVDNGRGFLQPDPQSSQILDARCLDVIFLPLVAFDRKGYRLGRGAGYYDRTLSFMKEQVEHHKPFLIGLGYDFQKIPAITPDPWDVPLDKVVTEKKIEEIL